MRTPSPAAGGPSGHGYRHGQQHEPRTIMHIDMDAFFASASLVDRPDLAGMPVLIGGAGGRGVVLAATYAARAYGVHSAMPMSRARRLCPQAVVISPDYERYRRMSEAVMHLFRTVTPTVEPVSMEEAFLDLTRSPMDPARLGGHLRDVVNDEQGITCSVGVAPSKVVAKMASRAAKPDGLRVVTPGEVVPFLHGFAVGDIWGVGESTEQALLRLGLRTVADLAHTPERTLRRALGEATGARLHRIAWGADDEPVVPRAPERSIGSDETFGHDVDDPVEIRRRLLRLADRTAARARSADLVGRTVTLKVRFSDFTTITRSRTLREHTDVSQEIYGTACHLYDALGLQRVRIRLVGVRLEGLRDRHGSPHQPRLGDPEYGWAEADRAIDRAGARFGAGAVRPASLIGLGGREHPGVGPRGPVRAAPAAARSGNLMR
ncbi:DNA polymerase IV [Dermacoccaceae bacterium W4C1]